MDDLLVERVLVAVEQVPRGRVVSYGDLAELVGIGPRLVGRVMSLYGGNVTWWRVTNASGDLPAHLADEARAHHATLIREVVRMLCAGVVHGDLSEFNVLLAASGPVVIDLPQAVDASGNNHAPRMLMRDVANLRAFFGRFAPELLATQYGPEIWHLYAGGQLTPASPLSGRYEREPGEVDLAGVMREIDDTRAEEQARRLRLA